jgi:predicted dehydrogenase
VGELDRVVATTEIWVKERPLPISALPFDPVRSDAPLAPVDVEDSAYFLGRFVGGAIGVFEISRCAPGRKNQLALEIHGSRGSVYFDYERANEVKLYLSDEDQAAAGFRTIVMGPAQDEASLVPFAGFGVGFMESILFQVRDLLTAIDGGPAMSPDFHDGWRAQVVVESVLESAQKGWVSVPPVTGRGTGARARRQGS